MAVSRHVLDYPRFLGRLLERLGVRVVEMEGPEGSETILHAADITSAYASYDLVRQMRASFNVLGPLIARTGHAKVSLPGGCAIGTRPVDLHLKALEQLGAAIELEGGYIHARAPRGLKGATVIFPQVSVGATENLLMAATLAEGETVLANAAREPEIADLAMCLMRMGARIEGVGTDRLRVEGVRALGGATHRIVPDRIEAGTYACAAAVTGGSVLLEGARVDHLGAVVRTLRDAGVEVAERPEGLRVSRRNGLAGTDAMTEPFPGFATDMQAQFMALMCVAEGASMITETIFENRFMHVPELMRMGARINYHGTSAIVRGVPRLSGAPARDSAPESAVVIDEVVAGLLDAHFEVEEGEGFFSLRGERELGEGTRLLLGKATPCVGRDRELGTLRALFTETVEEGTAQAALLSAIDHKNLVLALGPAGTGKTYLAIAKAVEALEAGKVGRIVLSRPAVEAGESLGFLPGDMEDKLAPYLRPLYDALSDRLSMKRVKALIAEGLIEIAPVGYMRGRTLNNAFVVIDEAQNCTYGQLKMLLTRLGWHSTMVVTGDPNQSDLLPGMSGLSDVADRFEALSDVTVVRLRDMDIVRHPLVASMLGVL